MLSNYGNHAQILFCIMYINNLNDDVVILTTWFVY